MNTVLLSSSSTARDRRLERACEHVSRLWFPANPALVARIRTGLGEGSYDLDIDFLIEEITDDFALFTWCLKGLSALVAEEWARLPSRHNPVEMLRLAGVANIRRLFEQGGGAVSTHDIRNSADFQVARLRHAMVSACAVEAIAPTFEIDREIGFSTALLRQLGLALIAWNYPTVYRRCLGELRGAGSASLDDLLSRALGFAPTVLAVAIVDQWGLSPEVQAAVGSNGQAEAPLDRLCRVGEALARANEPEVYPHAAGDWHLARGEIEGALGHEGVKVIQERAREAIAHYEEELPKLFRQKIELDPDRRIHRARESLLLESNQAARSCSPEVRKLFRELYGTIQPGAVDRATIDQLVREVVPACGFTGGIIYIVDPSTMTLVPRLRFGAVELRLPVNIPCGQFLESSDAIVTAFRCHSPITEQGKGHLGFMAGSIGLEQRAGVLYLEAPDRSLREDDRALFTRFRAVRQALHDCLALR